MKQELLSLAKKRLTMFFGKFRNTRKKCPNSFISIVSTFLDQSCQVGPVQDEILWIGTLSRTITTLPCPYICHEHCAAQSAGLQGVDDLGRQVGVVCNGRRDIHPSVSHVRSSSSLLASSHALQHSTCVFPVWVLQ